MPENFKAPNF